MQLITLPEHTAIYRHLSKDGLLKTLGIGSVFPKQQSQLFPTFILHSLLHYRNLEADNSASDEHENNIISEQHGLSSENLNAILVSCWSTSKDHRMTDSAVAIIESTVSDVYNLMNRIVPQANTFSENIPAHGVLPSGSLDHRKVNYYDDDFLSNLTLDPGPGPETCFYKRKKYEHEQEYRFSAHFNPNLFSNPYSFCIRLKNTNYIKKIHTTKHFHKEITGNELTAIKAYYSHAIPTNNQTPVPILD